MALRGVGSVTKALRVNVGQLFLVIWLEKQDDELNNNRADWQMAAKILDRLVLVLGILISAATFLAIFLQAPRVRTIFF